MVSSDVVDAEGLLRRAAVVRIYDVRDRLVVLGGPAGGHVLHGDSAALARAVLERLCRPCSRAALVHHLGELAGAPLDGLAVVDELLALLLGTGVIERVAGSGAMVADHGPGARVLVGICGAVAAMHAPAFVQALLDRGYVVRAMATREALRFVRTEGIEALTHMPVVTDMWPAAADREPAPVVPHLHLAQWPDAVVVWPASATTIGRIAAGDYGSIVAAVAGCTHAPVMLAPSMNPAMLDAAAVRRNLAQLVDDGYHVAHPTAAIELADAPDQRHAMIGGAPPPAVMLALLESMLREHPRSRPSDGADWDAVWRRDPSSLPWSTAVPDADLMAVIESLPPGADVLEIGAGLGVHAAAAAATGHRVVATEISAVAIDAARTRAPQARVVWLHDDITASRLHGTFDLVLDRGCAHLLDDAGLAAYAEALPRLVATGGIVVIKALVGPAAVGLRSLDTARIGAAFGGGFAVESAVESTMPGPAAVAAAVRFVLRRR